MRGWLILLAQLLVCGLGDADCAAEQKAVAAALQEEGDGALELLQRRGRANSGRGGHEVRMFRHCVRRVSSEVKGAKPGFADSRNYTSLPLPAWDTPEMWCTGRGAELIESEAEQLRMQRSDLDPSTLKVFVDTDQRDATTANSLLQGLANKDQVFTAEAEYYPLLFDAYHPNNGRGVCSAPDVEIEAAQKKQLLKEKPMPMGIGLASHMNKTRYREVLQLMQSFIGIGAAGPLADMTAAPAIERTADGKGVLTGAPILMKRFAQNMLYAHASGINYTNATLDQIYDFSSWIYWYRQVDETPVELVSKKACGALSIISALLGAAKEKANQTGVRIYVGHDSDLDALAYFFNVTWQAPPFRAERPTPPGSSLIFMPDGNGRASVLFAYQDFNFTRSRDGQETAAVKVVKTSPHTIILETAEAWIENRVAEFAGSSCLDACRRSLGTSAV